MKKKGGSGLPDSMRPELPAELCEALDMFNLMGGLDWSAVPLVFGLFDVRDPGAAIYRLAMIRDALGAGSR
jgi:hypothetical protein